MSSDHVAALEHAVQQTNTWLKQLAEEHHLAGKPQAYSALRAVLHSPAGPPAAAQTVAADRQALRRKPAAHRDRDAATSQTNKSPWEADLKARDVMVSPVITTDISATVQDVARLLLQHRISAVPVLDGGKLVGIVSEGDLLHRVEAGTQRKRSWWLDLVASDAALATEYVQSNSRRIADVMTPAVVTASPETPLADLATLMEKHSIKRVPIVSDGKLVGIVSRANLLQAVASRPGQLKTEQSDEELRKLITARLEAQPWAHTYRLNVTVTGGVADLWGMTRSEAERRAIRVTAENTPGVRAVKDNLVELPVGSEM